MTQRSTVMSGRVRYRCGRAAGGAPRPWRPAARQRGTRSPHAHTSQPETATPSSRCPEPEQTPRESTQHPESHSNYGTRTQSERDGERKKKQTKERKGKEREGYREGERMVELIRCGETVAVCNYSVITVVYLILSAQHGSTLLHDRHIKTEHRAH